MNKLFLYNTLSRKKEVFKSIKPKAVGLYTCGPTVYNFAHLGNLRTYIFEDFLKRTLEYNDYQVLHIMNITDVGHLTGDMDMGEDKLELGARREGKTALEIAAFYEASFKEDLELLNIEWPNLYCRATENIPEQIDLITLLEQKGYTYKTSDGIYFDTAKINDYNKLSHLPLDELKEGARVEKNAEKKNPTDFALWKFSPAGSKRQMEWGSPWGVGFPGWHIECSAMSLKYLGEELDIHCGGIDHINIHHTNEIAQSEAATSKKFFNYWLHGAFLNIKGGKKMAKSEGNFLTLASELLNKNLDPLAYRLATLQVHYRKPMEYNEEILRQAANGLRNLREQISAWPEKIGKVDIDWRNKFLIAINDDLNMPRALAVLNDLIRSKLSLADKRATIQDFDKVLGLDLLRSSSISQENILIPLAVQELLNQRQVERARKNWAEADNLRAAIKKLGYLVEDGPDGQKLKKY